LSRQPKSPIMHRNNPRTSNQPNPADPSQAIMPIPSLLSTHFWRPERTSHPPGHHTPLLVKPAQIWQPIARFQSEGFRRQSLRAGHYTPPSVRTRFPFSPLTRGTDQINPERPTRSGTRKGAPEPDSQL